MSRDAAPTSGPLPPPWESQETTQALLAVAGDLWPRAAVRGVRSRSPGRTEGPCLMLVPGAHAPRLVVPADRRSAARALLRFSADTAWRESAGRLAVAALLRCGGSPAFPDRILIEGDTSGSLTERLSAWCGEPVTFGYGVGSARVNRKPVLTVFDRRGRVIAFAKLGDTTTTAHDVTAEGAALRRLATRPWERIAMPTVVHAETWHGIRVLLISALATRPWPSGSRGRPPLAAMRELTTAYAGPAVPLESLPWWQEQRRRIAAVADRGRTGPVERSLDVVEARWGRAPVTPGAWHGDWTPWNMAQGRRRVRVWDWERFETGVPQGLDALHFSVNAITRRQGTSAATVRAGLAAGTATLPREARLPAALYLVAVLGRYLPLTETPHGDRIVARSEVVTQTLAAWLSEGP